MVIKFSMYVGLHDVYPTMDVNFAFRREVKMTAAYNFISLGEKMRKLLDNNPKRQQNLVLWACVTFICAFKTYQF